MDADDSALVETAPPDERIEVFIRGLTASATLRRRVLSLSEEVLDCLSAVLDEPLVLKPDALSSFYEVGVFRSLYLIFERDGDKILLVPDEIRAAIKQHIPDFCAEAKRYHYFRDTVYAAVCLYGVVTHADVQFLLRHYNPAYVPGPESEAEEFLGWTQHYGGLWLVDDLIAHDSLENFDADMLRDLIRAQKCYPRYLPERGEFAAYPESDIPDEDPLFEAFEKYLVKTSPLPKEATHAITEGVFDLTRLGYSSDHAFDYLDKQKALPLSQKHQAELWFRLCNFGKKIRRWSLHGHTEAEAAQFAGNRAPAQADPDRRDVFPLLTNPLDEDGDTDPDPVEYMKVGRNEPCPCGSGKKYKKCCGVK